MRRHMPTILDLGTEGLAIRKLQGLQDFMQDALDITTLPDSLRKRVEAKRKKSENKPTLSLGKKQPAGISQSVQAKLNQIDAGIEKLEQKIREAIK